MVECVCGWVWGCAGGPGKSWHPLVVGERGIWNKSEKILNKSSLKSSLTSGSAIRLEAIASRSEAIATSNKGITTSS